MAIFNGSNANDNLIGGDGNDILNGGAGNDTVVGGKGADTAHLGAGNDTFIWNPGDGNDQVDGGRGFDTLVFNGKATGETFSIDANGSGATSNRANGTTDPTQQASASSSMLRQDPNNIGIKDLTGTGGPEVVHDPGLRRARRHGQPASDTVNITGDYGQLITASDTKGGHCDRPASTVTISNSRDERSSRQAANRRHGGDGGTVTLARQSSHSAGAASTATDGSQCRRSHPAGPAHASSFVAEGR
jgi:hypothetical protein